MAYISLYRKYRPKSFSEVVGQEVVKKVIKNSILNDKISHAYIFSGPRGTGRTSIAKIFSKAVNCLSPIEGDICGECEVCKHSFDDEIDIIEIDAASNNGVDEIREIRNNVKLLPSNLKLNGYIIVFSLIKSVCFISIILSIVGLVLIVTIFDFTSFTNLEAFCVDVVNIAELYLLPL